MLSAGPNTKTLFLAIPRPVPWDNTLFSEVAFVMAEIRRFYEELNIFWEDETRHVAEALKKGHPDATDFERWKNSHSSLRRTIEDWKVCFFPSTLHFQNQTKHVFRIRHRAVNPPVKFKPNAATIHPYLLFVHPSSTLAPLKG